MADIELVIKIDKDDYKAVSNKIMTIKEMDETVDGRVMCAIVNGTPLPKGHGRLIDVNDLLDDINLEDNDYNRDVNVGEIITLENIDRIPTIIEAESEEICI